MIHMGPFQLEIFYDSFSLHDSLRFRQLTFRHLKAGQVNPTIWSIGKQGCLSILRTWISKGMRLRYYLPVLPWMLTFGCSEILKFYFLLGYGLKFLQYQYVPNHCLVYGKIENPLVDELIVYRMIVFPLYKWFPCTLCHRYCKIFFCILF